MHYLDTYVVAWLYAGQLKRIPNAVQAIVKNDDLLISPMVALELQYLYEIGRASRSSNDVLVELGQRIGLKTCDLPFPLVADYASRQAWTRDPFDRIIVGQAMAAGESLLTADASIQANFSGAVWPA